MLFYENQRKVSREELAIWLARQYEIVKVEMIPDSSCVNYIVGTPKYIYSD